MDSTNDAKFNPPHPLLKKLYVYWAPTTFEVTGGGGKYVYIWGNMYIFLQAQKVILRGVLTPSLLPIDVQFAFANIYLCTICNDYERQILDVQLKKNI